MRVNLQAAYSVDSPAEVRFQALVTGMPRFFFGSRTHCEHEAFNASTTAGPVEIVDNVAIAPRVPVQPGDRIEVQGEIVHDRGRIPIVHWTHHDPDKRHQDG